MAYKHEYDKAMTRLTTIIQKLYDGEICTIKELAEEFGVSTKTIQRDINDRLSHYPIERVGNKFRFMDGYRIEKNQDLVDDFVLDILAQMSEGMGGGFAIRANKMISKLKNSEANPFFVKLSMEQTPKKVAEARIIDEAIKTNSVIRFDFTKENSDKKTVIAKPLKLMCFDGFWYLLAVDTKDGFIKKYTMRFITNTSITNEKFEPSKDIEDRLENAINIWFDANIEPFEVRLLVLSDAAYYIQKKPISKNQQIVSFNDDGSIEIVVKITNLYEIIPTIKYWIPNIIPLSPQKLVEKLREEIGNFINRLS